MEREEEEEREGPGFGSGASSARTERPSRYLGHPPDLSLALP